jgi:hypothetical protein
LTVALLLAWQIITIVISEYHIPYPALMDNLKASFSWANLNVFELVETGCKVRAADTHGGNCGICCLLRHVSRRDVAWPAVPPQTFLPTAQSS